MGVEEKSGAGDRLKEAIKSQISGGNISDADRDRIADALIEEMAARVDGGAKLGSFKTASDGSLDVTMFEIRNKTSR